MTEFQVGEWNVQPSLNRLARGAEEVRLEPKVMQVLERLAETPGQVVTRETLVARVWPDVFVSEDVLHRAIRELRRVFHDDPNTPSYIETIRKRGYRLIAPVRTAGTLVEIPSALPRSRRLSLAAASIVLVAALGVVVYALTSRPAPGDGSRAAIRFTPLTSSPLNETDPAISPDGTRLAFAMASGDAREGSPHDLFMTDAAGRSPERLVAHPADDRYPSWSHDGSMLAFIRFEDGQCSVFVMPLQGRRERRVAACGNPEEPRVSWSSDGDWLIESFAPGPDPLRGWRIARTAAATGVREDLTLPAPGTLGDYGPSVSPDGSRIAFIRGINGAAADVFTIPFNGGTPTRITWDNQDLVGVDWSADNRSILYATDRAGGYTIWRADLEGGTPQLVVGGAAKLKHPSVARGNGRVTYESWSYEINLWETPIVDRLDLEGDLPAPLRPVIQTSDQWNHSPDFSPDGNRVAFISTRTGGAELWIADANGASARQLTTFGRAHFRPPRWSPDGSKILISASVNGQLDLYTVDLTGTVSRLTNDHDDEVAPSWSHDGGAVLYGARRSGTWQVMQLSIADGSRSQLTADGGYAAMPSPDGQQIFFTRLERPGLWSMPAAGGEARLVVPNVRAAETANWRVTPKGIYFIGVTANQPVIRRVPLAGGAAVDVAWLGRYSWPGFAVAPDGARVLYAHWDRRDANIMAMESGPAPPR